MAVSKAQIIALVVGVIAVAALGYAGAIGGDLVLYNHSPSIARGFYLRTPFELAPGAVVTVRARDVAPDAARARGFDADNDRFIKRIAAIAGQRVCNEDAVITIDGRRAARRYDANASSPAIWSGCRRLAEDEVLLLGDSADSFDGRYWGPTNVRLVTGVWRPL